MKKLFLSVLMSLVICIPVIASEYESPMSMYKDNYFIAGDNDDQVKFQLSAKFNVFYPARTGIYVGYTQTSWWTCYQSRDTFSSNYMPEAFFRLETNNNIFGNVDLGPLDYLQISPIQHASNGVEGLEHRGINIYYAQAQLSIGDVYNFGINGKGFGYYSRSGKNKDINDYRKNYEAEVFFKLKSATNWYIDKFELHAMCSGNPMDKGYYKIEGICQLFTSTIQPKFFIQYNKGYGINLLTYNIKETELRAGLIF